MSREDLKKEGWGQGCRARQGKITSHVSFSSTFSSIAMPYLRKLMEDKPTQELKGPQNVDENDAVDVLERFTAWGNEWGTRMTGRYSEAAT